MHLTIASDMAFQPRKHAQKDNMILDWFKSEEVVSFAQEIVREANRLFPPGEQKGKAIPTKIFQKKFDGMAVRTRTFALKNKLNIYKKAKLLNTIKWEMREAGQEENVIDEFISFLAPLLNK